MFRLKCSLPLGLTACLSVLAPPPSHAVDAAELLQQCLSAPHSLSHRSRIEVEITHKSAPAESHRLIRLESPDYLFVAPESGVGFGFLEQKLSGRRWIYDAERRHLQPLAGGGAPAWLFSEFLIDVRVLRTFALTIANQNSMGGQRYYTLAAATDADDAFPKRSFSFKVDGEGRCDLIRAAYFGADQKLRKKIFVQWRTVAGTKLLKALHVEDVQSLEAARYRIEDVSIVDALDPREFPAPPAAP